MVLKRKGERRPSAASTARGGSLTDGHVVRDNGSGWRVYDEGGRTPVCVQASATQAELAAHGRAQDRDAEGAGVHDGYHRPRDVAPSPACAAPREQLERARRVAQVRERARRLARAAR
jgi:hypothetical protein